MDSEVIIIGTIHGRHETVPGYTTQVLKEILVSLSPDLIGVELYGAYFNEDGSIRDDILPRSPESQAGNHAAKKLGVPLLPYDKEGRDEYYRDTDYFGRLERMNQRISTLLEKLSAEDPESLDLRLVQLAREVALGQTAFYDHLTPKAINSEAFDRLMRVKRSLDQIIIAAACAHPGYEDITQEYAFFRDEWDERNRIMAENIVALAARHLGGRVAITVGCEHRYMLRDLLSEKPGIVLREYWEVLGK